MTIFSFVNSSIQVLWMTNLFTEPKGLTQLKANINFMAILPGIIRAEFSYLPSRPEQPVIQSGGDVEGVKQSTGVEQGTTYVDVIY